KPFASNRSWVVGTASHGARAPPVHSAHRVEAGATVLREFFRGEGGIAHFWLAGPTFHVERVSQRGRLAARPRRRGVPGSAGRALRRATKWAPRAVAAAAGSKPSACNSRSGHRSDGSGGSLTTSQPPGATSPAPISAVTAGAANERAVTRSK